MQRLVMVGVLWPLLAAACSDDSPPAPDLVSVVLPGDAARPDLSAVADPLALDASVVADAPALDESTVADAPALDGSDGGAPDEVLVDDGDAGLDLAPASDAPSASDGTDGEASLCERSCAVVTALGCAKQPPCLSSCQSSLQGKCQAQGTALQSCIADKRTEDFTCNTQQRPVARPGVCAAEQMAYATCLLGG
jgi:hypothetical protein